MKPAIRQQASSETRHCIGCQSEKPNSAASDREISVLEQNGPFSSGRQADFLGYKILYEKNEVSRADYDQYRTAATAQVQTVADNSHFGLFVKSDRSCGMKRDGIPNNLHLLRRDASPLQKRVRRIGAIHLETIFRI